MGVLQSYVQGNLQDKRDERDLQLQNALQGATTQEEKAAVIHDAYAKDPSHLRQFVGNLVRRATGKQPQEAQSPYATPQVTTQTGGFTNPETGEVITQGRPLTVKGPAPKTRQEAFAGHAARGKTPEQQQREGKQQDLQAGNTAKLDYNRQEGEQEQQSAVDLIRKYVPQEHQAQALEDLARGTKGAQAGPRNIPGAAGQPYKNPQGQWVRAVQGPDGIVEQPMPEGWQPQVKPTKPLYKVIRNHAVLIDPNTGQVTHDLGLATEARTSTRQSIQYDADGTPHMVTLTTVSVPGGGNVEVDVAPGGEQPKGPAPKKQAAKSPGNEPKPKEDQLNFRKATPQSNAAKKAVDTAESSYLDVQRAGANGSLDPVGSQGVVLSWLRGRVNRVTNNEINAVRNLGGIFQKFDGNVSSLTKGTMTPQQYQWFLRSAKDNYENAKQVAGKYGQPGPKSSDGKSLADRLNEALQ